MTTCLHCGATTDNGLVLCDLSQRKAETAMEFLPVYFRNLARWRPPARPNGSLGGSGSWLIKRGDREGNQIGRALELAANDLATWARALADDRGVTAPEDAETEAETVEILCAWLTERLTSIGTLEWAGQFVNDVDRHERVLRSLTESAIPGWYAGACKRRIGMATPEHDGLCSSPTYVVPGLTWVTCGTCGSTTYARDHLDTVVDEARGWVARPMRLAEAAVALIDTELSVTRLYERIKKWEQRGKVVGLRRLDRDGDPVGPKRYRFGEVLDRIFAEGATRGDDDDAPEPRAS